MTVQELIVHLQKLPPDRHLVVEGYEGGYDDLLLPQSIAIQLNVRREWWMGPHDDCDNCSQPVEAVVLRGKNRNREDRNF
jgi:hypothetical protein